MNHLPPADLAALQQLLADRACIVDIETTADPQTDAAGRKWWDTRPMFNPHEQCDEFIEMNLQALQYAHQRGLISPHPADPHLVRIVKAGT